MLQVVGGVQKPLRAEPDNIVSTGVSLSKPESLVPLAVGLCVAFVYTQVIELIGLLFAKAARVKSKKVEQFVAAWCEAIYFSIQIFISLRLFWDAQWFWPSGWAFAMDDGRKGFATNGVDGIPPDHATRDMRAYYVCEFGYYAAMFLIIFTKKRKKDFWEMVFHHVVTSFLISLSYTFWHHRIGVIVMLLHNAFDPWLNIAKCAHYLFSGPLHAIADVSFGLGAVIFLISRLIMYPIAIYFAWFHASPVAGESLWEALLEEWVLKLLLCFLYPIHIFWFVLILKVAKKALVGGAVQGDERSDSEDEPDDKKSR